jgi:hypothetical protein
METPSVREGSIFLTANQCACCTIYIQRALPPDHLLAVSLHEMCHIGCPWHGPKFTEKFKRLNDLGAPIEPSELRDGVHTVYAHQHRGQYIEDLASEVPNEVLSWQQARRVLAFTLDIAAGRDRPFGGRADAGNGSAE